MKRKKQAQPASIVKNKPHLRNPILKAIREQLEHRAPRCRCGAERQESEIAYHSNCSSSEGQFFDNFEFVSPRRCTGRVGLGTAFKDARQGYPFGGSAGLDKRLSLLCGATIKRKARCAYAYTGILGKSGLGGQPKHLRSIFSHTQMAFSFFVYGFFWLFCTFLPFWVIHNCQNGKLCMSFHFLKQRKKEFSPYKKG